MEQAVLKLHDFPFLWPMGTVLKSNVESYSQH